MSNKQTARQKGNEPLNQKEQPMADYEKNNQAHNDFNYAEVNNSVKPK